MRVTSYVDAPPGSGLGSSSALVVALVEAFTAALSAPLGPYDVAHIGVRDRAASTSDWQAASRTSTRRRSAARISSSSMPATGSSSTRCALHRRY